MAIAKFKPDAQPEVEVNLPQIEPEPYKGVVVDSNYTPMSSLLAYVQGGSWTVNYYSQVLGKHNDLREQDTGQNAIYQQYLKIIGLELKVNDALTDSFNQDSATSLVTGSATVYPFLVPNVGDMFIASSGVGREGIFTVTSSIRSTFNRDSVFKIEYTLISYTEKDKSRFNDLETKTIRSYYFNKDLLLNDQNPMVIEEEYKLLSSYEKLFGELAAYYFSTFYSKEYSTLIVPGQDITIYDSFLTNYILKIVDTFTAPEVRFVRRLNTDDDTYMTKPQIWNMILDRNPGMRPFIYKEMALVSTRNFSNNPMLEGIRYSGINYVVYPVNPDKTVNSGLPPVDKSLGFSDFQETNSAPGSIADLVRDIYVTENANIQYIKKVLEDDYYVLSKDFYENTENKSLLEVLLTDFLNDRAVNTKQLYSLANQYMYWGRLEQFYYIPIVLTLIKSVIRSV